MTKRYLFKAKRIDNREWVQGYYCQISERGYIFLDMTNDLPNMIEVDVSTIRQCTGLSDKNGKLIWENDIVDCSAKRGAAFHKCLVLWNERKARFDVRAMGCDFPMTLDECVGDISMSGSDYEVIGSGFDNIECAYTHTTDSEVLKQILRELVDIHKLETNATRTVWFCPECGADEVDNMEYCPCCGLKLEWRDK